MLDERGGVGADESLEHGIRAGQGGGRLAGAGDAGAVGDGSAPVANAQSALVQGGSGQGAASAAQAGGGRGGPQRRNLTDGPIGKTLVLFALPLLVTNVLQSLSASVNALWVSHSLGEIALAATSNANLVLFFLLGAVFGASMATNILVAQAVGGGRIDDAKRAIGTSIGFFSVISVLVAAAGFVFVRDILHALGTPPDALEYAVAYLKTIFVALPFMYIFTFFTMTLRGAGDANTPFWFMLMSVALDALFNPLLIMGLGPFPRLGIAGAATATLVSQVVSLSAMLIYLYASKHFLRLRADELFYLKPDLPVLRSLIAKGLPMGLQMIVISASGLLMISLVNQHGSRSAAAYGVVTQLWNYVQMPALAIAAGCSSMTGQAVGAGMWGRVSGVARSGILVNLLLTGTMVAVTLAFQPYILRLFLPNSDGAIEIAQRINWLATWSFPLFGITFVLFGVVRATGAVVPPLIILSIAMLLVRQPFAWLLSPTLGADAIWLSFPVGSCVSVLLATIYYRRGRWREERMLESSPGAGVPAPA